MKDPRQGAPPPKKSLGQHFLFDPSILGRIVQLAGVEAGDNVLEIGPGPGGLTRALCEAGARVTALEADPRMVEHLLELSLDNLEIIEADALKIDFVGLAQVRGGAMAPLAESGGESVPKKFKLVANLPYNISGPLTAKLLHERQAFTSMTLMYQKEVAERIAAPPGGRVRGVLSALSQAFCGVKMGFRLPPGAFRPPPKVESAVITLTVLPEPVLPLKDEALFWKIVHECFQKRRKMLRNILSARVGDREGFFETLGLTGMERPEELSSADWIRLVNALS